MATFERGGKIGSTALKSIEKSSLIIIDGLWSHVRTTPQKSRAKFSKIFKYKYISTILN